MTTIEYEGFVYQFDILGSLTVVANVETHCNSRPNVMADEQLPHSNCPAGICQVLKP